VTFPHPAIRRAYIADAAASTLVLELDEPASVSSTAGLLPDFEVGTPRTVTSATAIGSLILLGLSGAAGHNDVLTLGVDATNTIRGTSGPLAPGVVTVDNQVSGSPPAPAPVPGAIIPLAHGDAAIVLAKDQVVHADASGGALPTITMPPNPDDGDEVVIIDVATGGSFGTHPAVVTANSGQTVEDPSLTPGTYGSTGTLNVSSESWTYHYVAAHTRWKGVK